MFEQATDIEFFLDRVGETVANGWLEVHSYTVLSTHFHILARSPSGAMPQALHHIQLSYTRYFNRRRKRDGPLARGRYTSRLVDSVTYRRVLVAYIDDNATSAGIAPQPDAYAFGSCRAYVWGGGPSWLCRDVVCADVCELTGTREYDGGRYVDVFRRGFTQTQRDLVERRIRDRASATTPIDELLGRGAPAITGWFRRKALLADGTLPGIAIVSADTIDQVVPTATIAAPCDVPASMQRTHWKSAARAVLLVEMAGLSQAELAAHLALGRDAARRLLVRGRAAVAADAAFASQLGELGMAAAQRSYGPFLHRGPDGTLFRIPHDPHE